MLRLPFSKIKLKIKPQLSVLNFGIGCWLDPVGTGMSVWI